MRVAQRTGAKKASPEELAAKRAAEASNAAELAKIGANALRALAEAFEAMQEGKDFSYRGQHVIVTHAASDQRRVVFVRARDNKGTLVVEGLQEFARTADGLSAGDLYYEQSQAVFLAAPGDHPIPVV